MLEPYTLNEQPTTRSTDTLIKAIDRIKELEEENDKLRKALRELMRVTYNKLSFKIAEEGYHDSKFIR